MTAKWDFNSSRTEVLSTAGGTAPMSRSNGYCLTGSTTRSTPRVRSQGRAEETIITVALLVLLLTVFWETVGGETVFHRRNYHQDQGGHERIRRPQHTMNYTEAVHYLQKYGYLEHCNPLSPSSSSRTHPSPRRTKRLSPTGGIVEEQVPSPLCSTQMVTDALRLLQRHFDLDPSGRLDDQTRVLMTKGRCGNSDLDEEEREEEEKEEEERKRKERRRKRRRKRRDVVSSALPSDDDGGGVVSPWKLLSSNPDAVDDFYTEGPSAVLDDLEGGISRRRRQAMFQNIAAKIRRHRRSDVTVTSSERRASSSDVRGRLRRRRRRKRTISILSMGEMAEGSSTGDKVRFQKDSVQWRLLDDGVSGKIPVDDQRAILELAFRMWSEVIPLKFLEANDVDIADVDVMIAFAKQEHMNCEKRFDGVGGELAHSWRGGDIHFDEDENYKRVDPSGTGIDLLKVAVHEVGHVLGLLHNDKNHSIMYPIYVNPPGGFYDDFELSWDDRKAVQKIYGVCKGSFDVVFDWLRKVPPPAAPGDSSSAQEPPPVHRPRYIFNTYFFRSNRYWMYENRYNRTRFGDPLYVRSGWMGLTDPVNAYAQVISSVGHEYNIDTYFFVGDSYFKYNDALDRVSDGFPRKISDDFGPKSDDQESIPDDLDAVLFDNRDSRLYFFKGDWVWIYDPNLIGRNGCCEGKRLFSELFPVEPPSTTTSFTSTTDDLHPPLTGDLDAAFYSYHFHKTFFFKGESVYENAAYNEQTPGVNRLRRVGAWYQLWFDICDVE